jgi:hypothetical protein
MFVPVQQTHMVRIKPLGHPLCGVIAPVAMCHHEPGDQQDRQADNEVNHRLSHGSLLIRSRPCLYCRSAFTEVACGASARFHRSHQHASLRLRAALASQVDPLCGLTAWPRPNVCFRGATAVARCASDGMCSSWIQPVAEGAMSPPRLSFFTACHVRRESGVPAPPY